MTDPKEMTLWQKMRHWTPRYLWRRARQSWYFRRHPDHPWLTPQAIHILDEWLRPSDRVFEWGSGRSTRWFAARVAHITSIEHNPQWFAQVQRDTASLQNAQVYLHQEDDKAAYTGVIDDHEPPYDLILVDGLLRGACTQVAIRHLVPGGLLVLDDAHRYLPTPEWVEVPYGKISQPPSDPTWSTIHNHVRDWRHIWTNDRVDSSLLLIKPYEIGMRRQSEAIR
jgi:SAM-dependent methyltransferase